MSPSFENIIGLWERKSFQFLVNLFYFIYFIFKIEKKWIEYGDREAHLTEKGADILITFVLLISLHSC